MLFAGVKFFIICILSRSLPPLSTSLAKVWSGPITKRAATGNQRNQRITISYEMHSQWNQSIISRG